MPLRGAPHFHDEFIGGGRVTGPCYTIAEIIERFLRLWRDRRQSIIVDVDALLDDLENAQLGTAIQEFLGDLDNPDWQHHWDALNDAPTPMKQHILEAVRDAAVNELDLYIDMAVDYTNTGTYGVEVTAGFDDAGSWRYLYMVHPAPDAN